MNTPPPESFDVPPSRKQGLVMGIVGILASVGVFTLVVLHKLHPEIYAHAGSSHGKDAMPEWMALGVGIVFGLAGISALCSCIFKSRNFAKRMQSLIGALILGFFGIIPFYAIHAGAKFIELPFIPERWNHVFSQVAFGVLGTMFFMFTLALIVSTIRNWRSPK